jgi:tripeptide aminopeptidase
MSKIDRERIISTFVDLARISSPSWEEAKVIDYIAGYAKKIGVSAKKIPCGKSHNLLLTMKGADGIRPVLFSGHTDTVTPCLNVKPVVSAARITSDGTSILGSDDKCAIAMFLEALHRIHEERLPHGPVEVLLSCAEEIGLKGIKLFDMKMIRSKIAFVFDCSGPVGNIIMKAPYHLNMALTVKGKAAHAGIEPEKGVNAINVLSEIITKIPSSRIDEETTLNVGMISGGRATNIVAEEASCILEIRSISNKKMRLCEKIVRETARKIALVKKARVTVSSVLDYSGFTIRESDPITRIVSRSLESIGVKPRCSISGGGSDTNVFNKSGIRAVNLSCGMQKVHTVDEYIEIKDLVRGSELVLAIIDTVFQGGK